MHTYVWFAYSTCAYTAAHQKAKIINSCFVLCGLALGSGSIAHLCMVDHLLYSGNFVSVSVDYSPISRVYLGACMHSTLCASWCRSRFSMLLEAMVVVYAFYCTVNLCQVIYMYMHVHCRPLPLLIIHWLNTPALPILHVCILHKA